MSQTPLIRVTGLTVRMGDTLILDNLTFDIETGTVTSVIGPNGAGKTTLLSAMLGLTDYTGTIEFPGKRSPVIGYVPQRLALKQDSAVTVQDLFLLTHQSRPVYLGAGRACRRLAEEFLALVSMVQYRNRKLSVLSGGELQRVLIALALSRRPDLLVMDEASAGIDIQGSAALDELVRSLNREKGLTVIMVSHDLSVVNRTSDRIVCINRKMVCQGPPEKVLTAESIAEAFGNPALHSHAHPHH